MSDEKYANGAASSSSARSILVVEPGFSGHRGEYVDQLSSLLIASGWRVTIATTPKYAQPTSLRKFLPKSYDQVNLISCEVGGIGAQMQFLKSASLQQYWYWSMARDAYRACTSNGNAPVVVLVPYLDNFIGAMALLGSPFKQTPIIAIAMRTDFHLYSLSLSRRPSRFSLVKRAIFELVIRRNQLSTLFTLDPTLISTRPKTSGKQNKLKYFPDPVRLEQSIRRVSAREMLQISERSFVITVYGAIDVRKGVVPLVRAVARDRIDDVQILIAGQQSEELSAELASLLASLNWLRSVVRIINRRIDQVEETRIFSASDVIWVGYQGHLTMSGVLIKAARSRIPVIGCDEGLIRWFIERYKLGYCVNVQSSTEILLAISQIQDMKLGWNAQNPGDRSYILSEHDWGHIGVILDAAIAQCAPRK